MKIKKVFFDPVILLCFVVLIILLPILKPGFFSVHDETHIVDVYEMIRSLNVNGFPPRFAPDFNFSLGYPYFNFYYHLPFYITTAFYYLGFSMTDSFKYMMGLAVILSASGFYFFLRNHLSKNSSAFGALIYILTPYFAVDLYVRGAFGELYIFALFPWCGFFLKKYLNDFKLRDLALSALSIGLLSISHNVLLPFIYTFLFLYGLVNLFINKSSLKNYFKLFLPFILGVLLASYYLLPAFLEVGFISTYEQINIADHFPFIKQLIIPHWGYGPSIWGPLDDISFDIGTVNLILLAVSFLIFKFAKREIKILLIFFWSVFGLALVLTNNRTLIFWESIRFLRLVQFPWRMLLLLTISTSFIGALTLEVLSNKFEKWSLGILATLFVLLLSFNIWHYHPSQFKEISDEKYLERYFANRTLEGDGVRNYLSPEYLNFTEDFIPPTIWQKSRPSELLQEVSFASSSANLDFKKEGLGYQINYDTPEADKIYVAKAYFPGWTAKSEIGELPVEPATDYGIIAVSIPKGSGSFILSFDDTPVRKIANYLSATALILILVLLISPKFKKQKP